MKSNRYISSEDKSVDKYRITSESERNALTVLKCGNLVTALIVQYSGKKLSFFFRKLEKLFKSGNGQRGENNAIINPPEILPNGSSHKLCLSVALHKHLPSNSKKTDTWPIQAESC